MVKKKRLGDILIDAGLTINKNSRKPSIYRRSIKSGGWILVKFGYVTEEEIMRTLSHQLRIPFIDLAQQVIDKKLVLMIPQHIAENYLLVPVSEKGKFLTVAMADPLNILAIDELSIRTKMIIDPVIAAEEDIRRVIEELYGGSLLTRSETTGGAGTPDDEEGDKPPEEEVEEGPISQLVNLIFSEAVKDRLSDIHIEPDENQLRIRCRVDGMLRELTPSAE